MWQGGPHGWKLQDKVATIHYTQYSPDATLADIKIYESDVNCYYITCYSYGC